MDESPVTSSTSSSGKNAKQQQQRSSRRLSGMTTSMRRPSALAGPIAQSLSRATSWILGRRDSSVPVDVPSKRISNGSNPPVEVTGDIEAKVLMSVRCGGASLRGYKHKQNEDTLCIEANLVNGAQEAGNESVGFAAVFDGHAGNACSIHLQSALCTKVKSLLEAEAAITGEADGIEWRRLAKSTLAEAFTSVDADFLKIAQAIGDHSGACAVTCLVKGSSVVVAHVGDCAVILIERAPDVLAIRLTRDHNARNSAEVRRVTSCGGVITNGRLNGKLQPFRAFGDGEHKQLGLTVNPDMHERSVTATSCLLLCSDGITNYMTDQEISEFVVANLAQENDDPAKVASALVLHASKTKHSLDDASAVLMVFDEVV